MHVGIDAIRFYTPPHYLDLRRLADLRQTPYAKYRDGLGQELMALTAPDEDAITLAAAAAHLALADQDPAAFDLLILATESGVDASKAGAIWVHRLLGLPSRVQALEVKQACCSGTAALQLALAQVRSRPDRRVLIVASDIARYDLASPGEPTQGAAAVAIVVSAQPRLLRVDGPVGAYTEDVMDFWRPPQRRSALVDGRLSIRMYLTALAAAYADYRAGGGVPFAALARCCYHLPFTRMAEKAHTQLAGQLSDADRQALLPAMAYNRLIGNSYTASLYVSLASLLENDPADLAGRRIGLYAYGSGCMGLFLSAEVAPHYRDATAAESHRRLLMARQGVDLDTYSRWHAFDLPADGAALDLPVSTSAPYRLSGIAGHARRYAPTPALAAADRAASADRASA